MKPATSFMSSVINIFGDFIDGFRDGWSNAEKERMNARMYAKDDTPEAIAAEISTAFLPSYTAPPMEVQEEAQHDGVTIVLIEEPAKDVRDDTIQALMALGYKKRESMAAVTRAGESCGNRATVEELIKAALRYLAPAEKRLVKV